MSTLSVANITGIASLSASSLTANGTIRSTSAGGSGYVDIRHDGTNAVLVGNTGSLLVYAEGLNSIIFHTNAAQRAIIDSSGNFQFNSGYGSVATAFGCRAWVNFTATTGTPTIRTSGNMTSITDNGVGDFTFNFTTAMPDTNYAFSSGVLKNEAGIGTTVASLLYGNNGSYTTSALRLVCRQVNDATGSNIDPFTGCVMVYR